MDYSDLTREQLIQRIESSRRLQCSTNRFMMESKGYLQNLRIASDAVLEFKTNAKL
jgi:hypothetical protein